MLEPVDLAVLTTAAFATAVISGIVGMAGGIILLSIMLLYVDPLVAIPLHGVVQLVSNSSRTWIQRAHVRWDLMSRYGILLLPMGALGLPLAYSLDPSLTKLVIGVFVLITTWRPGWLLLGTHPENTLPYPRFIALGGVTGFLSVVVGATGPLIAPFFLNLGLSRQEIVGSKGACQTLGHVAKIILFGFAGFAYAEWGLILLLLSVAVVAGTWVGSQLLEKVNERGFRVLFLTALTLVAIRLIGLEGWRLWQAA